MKFFLWFLFIGQLGIVQAEASPIISNLSVSSGVGYPGSRVTVQLAIQDPQGPGDIKEVLYLLVDGVGELQIPIFDDGTNGDRKAKDGKYTGRLEIPSTIMFMIHRFQIYVQDKKGNQSNTLFFELKILSREESA